MAQMPVMIIEMLQMQTTTHGLRGSRCTKMGGAMMPARRANEDATELPVDRTTVGYDSGVYASMMALD